MRALPILVLSCLSITACDQGSKAVPKNNAVATSASASGNSLGVLDDGNVFFDAPTGGNAVLINTRFTGTSAAGDEADMRLRYKVNPQLQSAVNASSQVVVSLNERGRATELYREKVDTQTMEGNVDITVTPSSENVSLVVGLEHLDADKVSGIPAYSTVAMPKSIDLKQSDLGNIAGMHVQLVPGTYQTAVVGDRREHRFAVRVLAQYDDQNNASTECVDIGSLEDDQVDLKPVIGLDDDAATHFNALEYGEQDNESPVTVSFSKESLGVYLVMDASSSIVENGVAHHMVDAVSRTVISLARFADFNYRIFGTDVYELASLRDINFDDSAGSGTALYYSIDTALEDIESYAPPEQNKLIIAISDGRDLASRNFYPAYQSHEQVREYISQRINTVRAGQNEFYNSQLSSYFIELPNATSNGGMEALAKSSGGFHFKMDDTQALTHSLQAITDYVGGTYDLVYSSQQTPDDTLLELEVRAGRCLSKISLPTQYLQ